MQHAECEMPNANYWGSLIATIARRLGVEYDRAQDRYKLCRLLQFPFDVMDRNQVRRHQQAKPVHRLASLFAGDANLRDEIWFGLRCRCLLQVRANRSRTMKNLWRECSR